MSRKSLEEEFLAGLHEGLAGTASAKHAEHTGAEPVAAVPVNPQMEAEFMAGMAEALEQAGRSPATREALARARQMQNTPIGREFAMGMLQGMFGEGIDKGWAESVIRDSITSNDTPDQMLARARYRNSDCEDMQGLGIDERIAALHARPLSHLHVSKHDGELSVSIASISPDESLHGCNTTYTIHFGRGSNVPGIRHEFSRDDATSEAYHAGSINHTLILGLSGEDVPLLERGNGPPLARLGENPDFAQAALNMNANHIRDMMDGWLGANGPFHASHYPKEGSSPAEGTRNRQMRDIGELFIKLSGMNLKSADDNEMLPAAATALQLAANLQEASKDTACSETERKTLESLVEMAYRHAEASTAMYLVQQGNLANYNQDGHIDVLAVLEAIKPQQHHRT